MAPTRQPSSTAPLLQFGGVDAYIALMQRCWAADPAERPDFGEVVRQLRCLTSGEGRRGQACLAACQGCHWEQGATCFGDLQRADGLALVHAVRRRALLATATKSGAAGSSRAAAAGSG